MAYGDAQGKGAHNGLLVAVVTGTAVSITSPEGATWDWGLASATWGGFGMASKRAAATMPGPVTIEVNDPAWDADTDTIHDLMDGMQAGTGYVFYLYPLGRVSTAKYLYGTFMFDELSLGLDVDDIIRQPFGLVASGDCYRLGM